MAGGSVYRPPTLPVRNERWYVCPISGWKVSASEARWQKGARRHPTQFDEPGYKEPVDRSIPEDEGIGVVADLSTPL